MKPSNLFPSAEKVRLIQGVEAEPIVRGKKTIVGGAVALVWSLIRGFALTPKTQYVTGVGEAVSALAKMEFSSARIILVGSIVVLMLLAGSFLPFRGRGEGDAHASSIAGRGGLVATPLLPSAAGENEASMREREDHYQGSISPTRPSSQNWSKKAEVKMAREKFFDTGTVKINYLDYGNSSTEPLVMLHGGAWCWEEYLSLIPSLAQRWHPYALDFRGNGRSGWVAGQYRLEDFTEDTLAFIRQLKTPVVLVGHSLGGAVALMVAARCPEKVKALVIEDTPVSIDNYKRVVESGREMYVEWLELKRSVQSEQELSLALADRYKGYPGVTSQWLFFFARCLWQLDPTYFDALLNDFDAFIKGYDKQLLTKVKCPVLFIRGDTELGAVTTDEEISWLKTNFSKVSYTYIRGVGHLLHLQDEGQTPVLTEMMKFLERIPK